MAGGGLMVAKPKIDGIKVVAKWDESPDTSWIGRYTDSPTGKEESEGRVIDRKARGEMDRGTYRYFVAAMSAKQTGSAESVEADYQRMESMNRGDFGFIGLWVEAEILVPIGQKCHQTQTIRSGGLWGIESDSGQDHLESIVRDELSDLRSQLDAFGLKVPRTLEAVPDRDRMLHAAVKQTAKPKAKGA